MKQLPTRLPRRRAPGGWIEPLEARIAPANFDLTPFAGQGPFTLEVDPVDSHIHITSNANGEIFDQTSAGANDNLFVTGGGAADGFIIASSAGGSVAFTGTLSVIIPGPISVTGAVSTGTDLVLQSTGAGINDSASILLGTSAAHFTAARNLIFSNGATLSATSGDIVLAANQGAPQNGTFLGISLDGATLTTAGTGKIQLNAKGGGTGSNNVGIALNNGAVISSTSALAGAGTIDLTGDGGAGSTNNQGIFMAGASTLITSARGAITLTGTGAGGGVGSINNVGVLLSNGAQITSTGTGATAATISVNGTGGGGTDANHGVLLEGSGLDPKITSIDGNIHVIGTGLAATTGRDSRGISLEQGAQILATGNAMITLMGTGGGGTDNLQGIRVSDTGTLVSAQNGAIVLNGTGGAGNAGSAGNNGVLVTLGGKVSAKGAGSLSVTGVEGGGTGNEGIAVTGANAVLESIAGSGLALTANNLNIGTVAIVNATTGVAKIRPLANSAAIDLGGVDGLSKLGITSAELHQITASVIELGDANSTGPISLSNPLTPESSLKLQTTGSISGAASLAMQATTNLTLVSSSTLNLSGTVSVAGALSLSGGGSFTLTNATNNFASVSIPSAASVSLREDSGFNLGPATFSTSLTVESAGIVTQAGAFGGAGQFIKEGVGTLILTAANSYTTTVLNNGTIQVGNGGAAGTLGSGDVTMANASSLAFNRTDTFSITNVINGNGSVSKANTGTLTLAGNNGYSGSTTVTAGTLLVDGTLANTASVGVASGATLGGSGTISPAAATTVNGFLAPGGSPGVLNTGNVSFTPAGRFDVEINGAFPAHDQLSVSGAVTLGGATLSATGAVTFAPGQQIVLVANDGVDAVSGTFAGLAEGATVTVNGITFRITYAGGTNGNDVVLAQPVVDTQVTLAAGDLVVTDIAAGGHDGTLTFQDQSSTGGVFVISDPAHNLAVTGIAGATLSADLHTVTVPVATVTGTQIRVNALAGDDTLTVDLAQGALTKALVFDGGTHGAGGDSLIVSGSTVSAGTFDFTGAQAGNLTLTGNATIGFSNLESIVSNPGVSTLTLNYGASALGTIATSTAAGGRIAITAANSPTLTFSAPSAALNLNGGAGADTINVNGLGTTFGAALNIDGLGGADSVTFAAALPTIPAVKVTTEQLGALPALNIGAGGLDLTATAGGIDVNGGIAATGPVKLQSSGAITNTAGAIAATNVTLGAVDSIAMSLDGARLSAAITGAGGIALTAVNNAVSIISLAPGTGGASLVAGSFELTKTDCITRGALLVVDGTLDLKGFFQTVSGPSGAGTITNSAAALATFTVGFDDSSQTFSGKIQGHLALVKTGAGKTTLSGASNSYDGGTTIGEGTLEFGAFGSALNGAFDLAGGTLLYNLSATLAPALTLSASSTIAVATTEVVTLTSLLAGPGSLTKNGTGTLVLTNANNSFGGQTGKVKILGGTLRVPNDGALGDVANDVEINDATFAASAAFGSARNFTKTGGTATIDAQAPDLTLINKAIVPADLTPTNANLKFVFTYADGAGTPVNGTTTPFADGTTVTFGGNGSAHVHSDGMGGIDTIELSGTDGTSKLVIKGPATGFTTIKRIVIDDANPATVASIGSITLGKNVRLGDEVRDSVAELYVEGKAGKLQLYDVNSNALIDLGEGLLHGDSADKKTASTKTNHPDLKIHEVRGPGVLIDLTPSDLTEPNTTPIGGGGLGKVLVDTWTFAGGVRTTQSMSSFKLVHGDCFIVFELDKKHVGSDTQANCGSMTIQNGSWGSSGSEIEGDCGSFNADAFLLGATLTCGSMGKFGLDAGAFAGLLTLTDPDASGIPTFTVNSNFTGTVDSESPLRKIKVKGDFMGSLEAPFIGSITAYSFLGAAGPGNMINATDGSLGTLTATAGVVKNFTIITDQAFKGFNVKLGKLAADTVGIDNVHIRAASIGNISVTLAAAAAAAGVDLTGIRDSEFVTTANGTAKTDLGSIGNVTVTLTGGAGGTSATGIKNSTFDALVLANEFPSDPAASTLNALGKITVKVSGQDGASLGLENATFSANSIGAVAVSVSKGKSGIAAHAIETATFTAKAADPAVSGTIGALAIDGDATEAQVQDLKVTADANVGAVTVKAKNAPFGTLDSSVILAGQALTMTGSADPAKLARATLGAVSTTGSILASKLVAGSSIGAITVGKDVTGSSILAGAKLGGDFALDGDETYQRTASIAAITVKGALASTSIAAGVNPGNFVFGDSDTAATNLSGTSSIGAIIIGSGATPTSASLGSHSFAIEAGSIKSLKVGAGAALASFAAPLFIDSALPAGDSASDVVVRLV